MNWTIYIVLILLLTYLDIKYNNKFTITILVFVYFLLGFREKLGWDYDTYTNFYNNYDYYYKEIQYFNEVGFNLYICIIKKIGLSSQAQFIFPLVLKVATIIVILKKSKYRSLGLLTYLALPMFAIRDFSNIRQSLSESIFIYFLYIFSLKNKKRYLILMLGGVFFHEASILNVLYVLLLIIWITPTKRLQNLCSIVLGIIGLTLPFVLEKNKDIINLLIGERYSHYFLDPKIPKLVNLSGTFKGTVIIYIVIILIYIIITREREVIYNEGQKPFYIVFLIGFWMYIICARLPYPIARLSYFGLQSLLILLPRILERQNLRKFKVNCYHLFFGVVISLFFIQSILKGISSNTNNSLTNKNLRFNFIIIKK